MIALYANGWRVLVQETYLDVMRNRNLYLGFVMRVGIHDLPLMMILGYIMNILAVMQNSVFVIVLVGKMIVPVYVMVMRLWVMSVVIVLGRVLWLVMPVPKVVMSVGIMNVNILMKFRTCRSFFFIIVEHLRFPEF